MKKLICLLLTVVLLSSLPCVVAENGKSKLDEAFESGQVTLNKVVPTAVTCEDIEFVISDAAAAYYGIENKFSAIAKLYEEWDNYDGYTVTDRLLSVSPDREAFLIAGSVPMILRGNRATVLYVSSERGQKDWYDSAYKVIASRYLHSVYSTGYHFSAIWSPDGRYITMISEQYNEMVWSIPFLIDTYSGEIILPGIHSDKLSLHGGFMMAACFSEDSRYMYYVLYGFPSEYGEFGNEYYEKHVRPLTENPIFTNYYSDSRAKDYWLMCYDIENDTAYPLMNVDAAVFEKHGSDINAAKSDTWIPYYPQMYCKDGRIYMHVDSLLDKPYRIGIACVYQNDDKWEYDVTWLYNRHMGMMYGNGEGDKIVLAWTSDAGSYVYKVLDADNGFAWNDKVYFMSSTDVSVICLSEEELFAEMTRKHGIEEGIPEEDLPDYIEKMQKSWAEYDAAARWEILLSEIFVSGLALNNVAYMGNVMISSDGEYLMLRNNNDDLSRIVRLDDMQSAAVQFSDEVVSTSDTMEDIWWIMSGRSRATGYNGWTTAE